MKGEGLNHLGNVLETVTDIHLPSGNAASHTVDYYVSDVIGYSDYFVFGSTQSNRAGGDYRYDFNGKETDNETGIQDYGFRIYNTSLGKFLSVDPLTGNYAFYSPYQFAGNTPTWAIDLEGLEKYFSTGGMQYSDDDVKKYLGTTPDPNNTDVYVFDVVPVDAEVPDPANYTVTSPVLMRNLDGTAISYSDFTMFSGMVVHEDPSTKASMYGIASCAVNYARFENRSLHQVLTGNWSSAPKNFTYDNGNEVSKMAVAAVINALTGGYDYSNGSILFDGFDLAGKGYDHIKPRTLGVNISQEHYDAFKAAWPNSRIKAFSGGSLTGFSTNFGPGIHKATAGDMKGSCVLRSRAVHGSTMFWGLNSEAYEQVFLPKGTIDYDGNDFYWRVKPKYKQAVFVR